MSDNIRRQPKRFPVELSARFRSADGAEKDWVEGHLVNLSEGGLCLKAEAEILIPGEVLEIVIDSIDKKGVKHKRLMRAKVVWRKEGRAGVQFMKPRTLPQARPRKASKGPDRGQPKLSLARKNGDGTEE